MIDDIIFKTVNNNKMISPGDKVLVGVSGGFDSTALLYLLNLNKKILGIELFVAHLDHKIRGINAVKDGRYVEKMAKRFDIKYIRGEFDVPAFAIREKLSLEDAARQVRYRFLEETAAKVGANKIAVAHNADDNIETFIMRLIRGAGSKGLEGIPKVRGKIIRPMIDLRRADIEKYCRSHGLRPRSDESNNDNIYLRNRIRNELLPQLTSYNPKIRDALSRAMILIAQDHNFIRSEARRIAKRIIKARKDSVEINKIRLLKLDPALQSEILRHAIEGFKNDLYEISYVNVTDILKNINKTKAELHLSGVKVKITRGAVILLKASLIKARIEYEYALPVPGMVNINKAYIIRTELIRIEDIKGLKKKNPYVAYIDQGKVTAPLCVRNWRHGDRFVPLGSSGTKKVQDIFVDQKLDIDKKERIPLVEDRKRIVWIAGYRIDEHVKVNPGTSKVIRIKCSEVKR